MPSTPKTAKELVDQLITLEQENTRLRSKLAIQQQRQDQMKGVAVALITRSRKQNEFTSRQVKEWGEQILGILNSTKRPKDLRPGR